MNDRSRLIETLFPAGIPRLWCPTITHYTAGGALDAERIAAHLRSLAPFVKGLLVPGSTGDGWEMDAESQQALVELVLDIIPDLRVQLLVGVLRTDAQEVQSDVRRWLGWLCERTGKREPLEALRASQVCGFTVCPPKGADLSQQQIRAALRGILEIGAPTALYQLPQVTLNIMQPETVAELATAYPNFFLFKDTSGEDLVATSAADLKDVFLVRGAEGHYDRWVKTADGPYDGFLLSTANCFAPQLHSMLQHLDQGQIDAARESMMGVEAVVAGAFERVAELPDGNAFANANKAIDHFLAFGPQAESHSPPRLRAGSTLPTAVLRDVKNLLQEHGLLPTAGYVTA